MEMEELERLAAAGESDTVEFKRSTGQLTRAGETLCGFLNGNGGRVLIGVRADGQIQGQDVSDSTQRDVADLLRHFEPPPPIEMTLVRLRDTECQVIVLSAPGASDARPFTFRGRPYRRVGTTTSVMPQEGYQQALLERAHSRRRWENEPASGVAIDELDHEEILRTVRLGIEAGRLPEATRAEVGEVLERLGICRDGQLLNAAIVLFGTRFLPEYPQCQLRMARFRGVDKTEFLDQRQLHGHTFELLEEAMLFLRRHLPVAGRIQPGLFEREDEPLFPLAALREALVNAFCHRNYQTPGGAVSLGVYDDRLEIWSDGTLPFGLRPEDLKRDHPSRPRNPLIAEVFYRRGLIERWGRGTQKIVELCVRAGHPEPEFGEQAGSVWVRFLPSGYIAPHRVPHDLTQRQREVLQLLARTGKLRFSDIRNGLENPPSDRSIRNDLTHLRRLGLTQLEGHGRGARWSLVKRADE